MLRQRCQKTHRFIDNGEDPDCMLVPFNDCRCLDTCFSDNSTVGNMITSTAGMVDKQHMLCQTACQGSNAGSTHMCVHRRHCCYVAEYCALTQAIQHTSQYHRQQQHCQSRAGASGEVPNQQQINLQVNRLRVIILWMLVMARASDVNYDLPW